MVDVIELAEAVADHVSAPGETDVHYAPELDLKAIRELRIVVVPAGVSFKPVARGYSEQTLTIQIGVLKKCTEDDVPDLVNTVISIGRGFLDKRLADAVCTDAKYEPLYDPVHLRERRQFTGIVTLTFKAVAEK